MTLKSFSFFVLAVSGFGIFSHPVAAQNSTDIPLNFPPASFQGTQFVDNRGCVYVRAGFDGLVNWVPRVTRGREHICGQTPTFGSTQVAAPAPAPRAQPAPAPQPAQVTAAPPAPRPAAAPTPQRVVRSQPAPQPVVRRVMTAPAPKPPAAEPPRVVRRVPAPQPAAPVVTTSVPAHGKAKVLPMGPIKVPAQIACAEGRTYRVVDGRKTPIRCGPQQTPHATVIRRGDAPASGANVYYNKKSWEGSSLDLPPETRIVPKHVYDQRDTQVAHVPEGYSPAWEDDRLNSYRAYQTVQGHQDTQQVWTNTVPRELVSQARRHEVKPPVVVGRAASPLPLTPVVTTKGKVPVTVGRWIEVGAFSTEGKARQAVSRLQAAGFTVRMGQHSQNGRSFSLLRVGPYADDAALRHALNRVHGTGYTQAYVR
ncbi:SPOR domain-containing protein [Maliponia aquimaris]|uniref:Sporulation related domain protein n=1 Tax=Maliponia aquimaris TaxID=1673631 RepID=A0A238K5C3_9RHOB|nr:SPOR domain-containing protein [Maliponia aquimaris]SMX38101.1 Sporulation related domain protein [Maliponia aquimaris]